MRNKSYLTKVDYDEFKIMIKRGHSAEYVAKIAQSWADQYANDERIEGLKANEFERNAY